MSPRRTEGPIHEPPGRAAIARAIPAGSKRARNQRDWLHAVEADPEIAALRADKRRTVIELAKVLVLHADWQTMTAWRPRALACEEIGSSRDPNRPLSVSAYKAARRVLEGRGFLGLVAQGWTSALRALVLDDRTATSAVFVLTLPCRASRRSAREEGSSVNRPLAGSRSDPVSPLHAREEKTQEDHGMDRAPRGQSPLPRAGAAALGALPETRSEVLGAVRALQERAAVLRRISAEYVRSLYRPFMLAGWLPRDLIHALDHGPNGRQHGYTTEIRFPGAWIRSRLAEWLTPDGTPLPSRSQRMADDRRRVLAEQAEQRARDAAARTQVADYPAAAARARAMLARALHEAQVRRPRPTSLPLPPLPDAGRRR